MNDYRLLLHLDRKQFVNSLKSILQNPKRLLIYVGYIAFMVWVVFINVSNSSDASFTEQGNFEGYVGGGLFILLSMTVIGMLKKSSIFFKMADVNYLFTAPIDNRKILLITLIKRIPVYIMTTIYTLIFILSIVFRSYSPDFKQILITTLSFALVYLITETISFMIFVISAKWKLENLRAWFIKGAMVAIFIPLLVSLYKNMSTVGWNLEGLLAGVNDKWLNFIPIIGWGRYLILTVLSGITSITLWVFLGMVLTYLILIVPTFLLADDYYEDVLQQSEQMSQLKTQIKTGRYKKKIAWQFKKKVSLKDKSTYGKAFNWKRKIMILKSDFSLYFSLETLLGVLACLGAYFFLDFDIKYAPYIISGIYFYLKFLFFMQNHLGEELDKPYIYVIPDSPKKKILATVTVDLMRFMINVIVVTLISAILSQNFEIGYIILPLAATSTYAIMLLSNYLVNLFLPSEDVERLYILLRALQMILLLVPSIIATVILGIVTQNVAMALGGMFGVNGLIAFVILMLSDVLFEKLEFKK